MRDSFNFAHSQKIVFIRSQAYSLFDLASPLSSNNLWELHLGPLGSLDARERLRANWTDYPHSSKTLVGHSGKLSA